MLKRVESILEDGQFGFRQSRSATNQNFTVKNIIKKCCNYGKDLFACFVNLETAYEQIPRDKLYRILLE